MPKTETQPSSRTEEESRARNLLQRELINLYLEENSLDKQDTAKMLEIFRQVSDIIDNDSEEHHSIIVAYESGDFRGAAQMLKTIIAI